MLRVAALWALLAVGMSATLVLVVCGGLVEKLEPESKET
jgi:hypothetical protein